ncbi:MAG: transglycosylase SLT domain-containing protein [Actinophytocola sp.]|uniref:transglycosylase SLT domain-containing protein n=1 Tax=Actinophytocola sp. TaxID=1872138 RepID=UPI00132A31A1|nr:transglycosylase SLT domain-containing protein [Actinophytocola sp.]MPZ79929.1 transglycosylase SLT domain-containing protein [Actinophytocola sp.]
MTAAETLAGYAGGDAVATAAAKVANANSGTITEAATRLTDAASNVGTYGGEVAGGVTQLDAAWEGTSADAFVAYMGKFAKAGTDIGTAMSDAAGALEDVAGAIDDAKHFVSTRCDQALREIRGWLDDHPQATQQQLDDHTEGICSEVAGDIDTHLQSTEQTLAGALGTINGAKTPASTFTGLSEPNSQPFTPHPGQVVEWTPTPEQETTPAGTDEPGQSTNNSRTTNGSGGDSSGSGGSSGGGGGGGGGGSYSGPSSGGPPAGGPPPGNVQEWIRQAIEELRKQGINVSEADAQRIWQIIEHESGGNPHAINDWDSNAAKGTPSKGLMQCIDPTFDSYKLPGHGDIWNPVDNICAGVNYALSRYGSLADVPGIKATEGGGGYVGY